MESVFDLLAVLVGLVVLGLGLVLVYAVWFVGRRSVRALPDDRVVARLWEEQGVTPLPDGHRALRSAAARIEEGSVDSGHEVLGLPAPSGVRLAGRVEGSRPWFVADVWNVNPSTASGSETTAATVQVRAVAAMELERETPPVVVARENAMTLLADAAGLGDVRLEGEGFNRAFRVRAPSSKAAYAVLTPEVMHALELGGDRFALEFNGRLLTLTEVSGLRGRPATGQRDALPTLIRMMGRLATGTREHTWPDHDHDPSPDEWRGDSVVVDPRAPGAPHPLPRSTGRAGDIALTLVGLALAGVGVVVTSLNLIDLVAPG